jgi:hypothetical protein
MLSPRTVHFTAVDVVWECRERCHCQMCAEEDRDDLFISTDLPLKYEPKKAFLRLYDPSMLDTPRGTFHSIWSGIIEQYTRTELSNADDRLSALAEIAHLAYEKLHYQASYGLWLETFLDDLLWSSYDALVSSLPRNTDVLDLVPSWSWASNRPQRKLIIKEISENVLVSALILKLPPATPFAHITQQSTNRLERHSIRIYGWLRAC